MGLTRNGRFPFYCKVTKKYKKNSQLFYNLLNYVKCSKIEEQNKMGNEEYDFEKLDSYSEDEQQKAIDLQEQYIDSLEEAMKSNSNYSEEPGTIKK